MNIKSQRINSGLGLLAVSCHTGKMEMKKQPKIIFILTDDQGCGDISALRNPVLKKPHLDRPGSDNAR